MPENEIQFQATIDAQSFEEFFNMMDQRMNAMEVAVEGGFDQMDDSMQKTGQNITVFSGLFQNLWMRIIDMVYRAAGAIKNFIEGSIELRATVDTLGITMERVGVNAGYTAEEVRKAEEAVRSKGITTQAARQSIVRLIQANIDLAEAEKLARLAQDAAVNSQLNSSQAYERLVSAIQRQEPELLDELLLQVDRTKAYRTLAIELDKNVDELSQIERQQAFLNEIYRQGLPLAGSYEEAMGSVGKQMTSLPRYIEEVQLAVGGLFQGYQAAKIDFYTRSLKSLQTWLDDNKDSIDQWSNALGEAAKVFFDFIEGLKGAPQFIVDVGVALASLFGDDSEVAENAKNLSLYAQQAIAIYVAYVAAVINGVVETVKIAYAGVKGLVDVAKGELTLDELKEQLDALGEESWIKIQENTRNALNTVIEILPALDQTEDKIEDIADATADAVVEAQKLKDAFTEASYSVEDLADKIAKERDLNILRQAREATERDLRESFRREDIEKRYQDRIAQIEESGQESQELQEERFRDARIEAADRHSKNLLAIEKSYQRALRDIQKDFEFEANELARKRDAVGLLELQRQHTRQLDRARQNRDDRAQDADESYQDELNRLDEALAEQEEAREDSLQKQLDAAEEARQKDYEALELSLDRERQIRALHARWEIEDWKTKHDELYEELGTYLAGIEGLTAETLAQILQDYEDTFGEDGIQAILDAFLTHQIGVTTELIHQWGQVTNSFLDMLDPIQQGIPGPYAGGYQFPSGGLPSGVVNFSQLFGLQQQPGPYAGGYQFPNVYQPSAFNLGGGGSYNPFAGMPQMFPSSLVNPNNLGPPPGPSFLGMSLQGLGGPGSPVYETYGPGSVFQQTIQSLVDLLFHGGTTGSLGNQFYNQYGPGLYMGQGQSLFGQAGQVSAFLADEFPKTKRKTEPDEGSVFGQAGQVSSLLADALSGMKPDIVTESPSRLPAATPQPSVQRREIHVTADLEGVDPYLQEKVLNTMLEIERNKG